MRPAIVVVAYNRPHSLGRLIGSLQRLVVSPGDAVPLIISVDGGDSEVMSVAERAEWPHGPTRVISHSERLGLREHVLSCGDLSDEYGAVVVLEDDLICGRNAYAYVEAVMQAYDGCADLCGYALYQPRFHELTRLHFHPATGGYDSYLACFACSQGQVWTRQAWQDFRAWYRDNHSSGVSVAPNVPSWVAQWPETSWKKYFQRYMAETGKWMVYPAQSQTSGSGDPGEHIPELALRLVTVLDERSSWRFTPVDEAWRYDAWLEPTAATLRVLWPFLPTDLEVDLQGSKPAAEVWQPNLLSPRSCRAPARSFSYRHLPLPYNLDEEANDLFLGPAEEFRSGTDNYYRASLLNGPIEARVALSSLRDRLRTGVSRRVRRVRGSLR